MEYTNQIDHPLQKPDSYDWLKHYLDSAKNMFKSAYVVAISREYLPPEIVIKQYGKMKGVYATLPVNGTIDFVVGGGKRKALKIANQLHNETREPIGCIEYDGKTDPLNLYVNIRKSIDLARKREEAVHFYDPKKDSLGALIKKELAACK